MAKTWYGILRLQLSIIVLYVLYNNAKLQSQYTIPSFCHTAETDAEVVETYIYEF